MRKEETENRKHNWRKNKTGKEKNGDCERKGKEKEN